MASYSDIFGTGAMPTFNIGPGHGNTSWKYGGDESAAIMDEHLAQRAADFADQKATFQDTTMPALKAMFNPDEPEKDPLDALLEATAGEPAEQALIDEEEAKALDSHAAAVQAMTSDEAYREERTDSELGEDVMTAGGMLGGGPASDFLEYRNYANIADYAQGKIRGKDSVKATIEKALKAPGIKGQLAKKIAMRAALMGTGPVGIAILLGDLAYQGAKLGSSYAADAGWIEDDYVGNFEEAVGEKARAGMDAVGSGVQAGGEYLQGGVDYMRGLLPESWQDESTSDWRTEEQLARDKAMGDKYRAAYGYRDGGRIGLNTGGLLPWTQTMDSDYANQYYNQFNDPVYTATQGATTPTNPTTPDPTLGFAAPMTPAVPLSGGLAQQRGRGPEDRGTFAERFGTAEDQGYGYSGTPGEGGSATFNDPAYGSAVLGTGTGDTYTPAPGIGYADDEYGRKRYIGIADDLGLNLYNAAYPVADALTDPSNPIPGVWGWLANKVTGGTKKDEEEAEAEAFAQETLQKAQDERFQFEQNRAAAALAAQQKQQEEKAAEEAKQQFIADTLAAINSGGEGSNNNNTSQTSTSTGSGGSPSAGGVSLGTSLHGGNQYTGGGSHGGGPHSGGGGGGGDGWKDRQRDNRIGCFVKGTMIQMADGTEKEITTIEVGEETKGGQVQAKMEFLPERIYDYKGVKVSGSHWVIEDGQFIEVENSKHGVLTDRLETVYCFKTSDNRIWIKGIEFGDFETGSDSDWEPHFEMVKQKLNKELREQRL